jgi:3-methyladenine DNA glycosylase AlkD
MIDVDGIQRRVSKVQHGFLQMQEEALKVVKNATVPQGLTAANQLYKSKAYQARSVGVFILGYISPKSKEAFGILRKKVSTDESWQVQEILAKAFDEYCRAVGYEKALPMIKDWLGDKSPNVRRAVTEGLRIWNGRDYFREHPEVAVQLLSKLKDDDSEYVRRSVGNALRDISRKEKDLIKKELAGWDKSNPRVALTYKLASKFL